MHDAETHDLVGSYFLWKLLIDAPFQGRGFGAATIDAVVDYLRYGFTDTGREMWGESILALDLAGQPRRLAP